MKVKGGNRETTNGTGRIVVERTEQTICTEGVLTRHEGSGIVEELIANVAGEVILEVSVTCIDEGYDV